MPRKVARSPEIEHAIAVKRAHLEVYQAEQARLLIKCLHTMNEIEALEQALVDRQEDAIDLAHISALAGQPVTDFVAD